MILVQDTTDNVSLLLLCWSRVSAGVQALRKQLQADQSDPDKRQSQASVTRRVGTANAGWQSEQACHDFTTCWIPERSRARRASCEGFLVVASPKRNVEVQVRRDPSHLKRVRADIFLCCPIAGFIFGTPVFSSYY